MIYKDAKFEDIDAELQELVRSNYIDHERRMKKGLFLTGKTGVGKTHTLHSIKNKIEQIGGSTSQVENWVELLFELREKISKGFLRDVVNNLTDKQHIFIDDLGAEKQSEWGQEMLYLIVNKVYEAGKPLFLGTNLTIAEFTAKYGERIASRLLETCEVRELTGDDRRIK